MVKFTLLEKSILWLILRMLGKSYPKKSEQMSPPHPSGWTNKIKFASASPEQKQEDYMIKRFNSRLKITGRIAWMGPIEKGVSEKGEWRRQTFAIYKKSKDDGTFNMAFEARGKMVSILKNYKANDKVYIEFLIRSLQIRDKWHTNLIPVFIELDTEKGYKQNEMADGSGQIGLALDMKDLDTSDWRS